MLGLVLEICPRGMLALRMSGAKHSFLRRMLFPAVGISDGTATKRWTCSTTPLAKATPKHFSGLRNRLFPLMSFEFFMNLKLSSHACEATLPLKFSRAKRMISGVACQLLSNNAFRRHSLYPINEPTPAHRGYTIEPLDNNKWRREGGHNARTQTNACGTRRHALGAAMNWLAYIANKPPP